MRLLLFLLPLLVPDAGTAGAVPADLSRHPLYSRYDFGAAPNVIDFATQPVGIPQGVITEVMKRDRILRAELKKKGYELRFHPFLKGDDMTWFVRQGKIEAAAAGDIPTIIAASTADISVVALTKQGFSSVVTTGSSTVYDLKGKKIGYPPLSSAHYGLLAALAAAGLEKKDVRLVPMELSRLLQAMSANEIDAFAAWEPLPTIAAKNLDNTASVFRYLNYGYLYFNRSFADQHPEAASLLLAAMVRALQWMRDDDRHLQLSAHWTLASAKALLGKPLGLSADEVAGITRRDILSLTSHPTIPERDLTEKGIVRRQLDFLKEQGVAQAEFSTERVLRSFDRKSISRVLTQRGRYRLDTFSYDTDQP